jgi:hypothetical protein
VRRWCLHRPSASPGGGEDIVQQNCMRSAEDRADPPVRLATVHRRRLRDLWRSAGWPCQDTVEVELLAAGLIERRTDTAGRDTLRLTDAGVRELAAMVQTNRAARDAHEALVARVAAQMQRAGRVVWRGLSLRAPLPADDGAATTWAMAMPDVYSIRHTTVEDFAEPIAHEIKVRRSDLLSDLRHPAKGEAYRALAGQCWYVLRAGIAQADEVPAAFGVMWAHDGGELEVARPAPKRAMRLSFPLWMALARATPCAPLEDDAQSLLGKPENNCERGDGPDGAK